MEFHELISRLGERYGEQGARAFFFNGILALGAVFAGLAWIFFHKKAPEVGFRLREADRVKDRDSRRAINLPHEDSLAEAKIKKTSPRLLPGIRIDGRAHEILGVSPQASVADIQKAYRVLMKQYHPDVVARPGTPQWAEAQKIAEALNRAKEELLRKHQSQSPNRSGR